MTKKQEWFTLEEAAAETHGKLITGSRMLVDGRPAEWVAVDPIWAEWVAVDPIWGMVAARWTDEEGGYAVNFHCHEVLVHRDGITRTLEHLENTK